SHFSKTLPFPGIRFLLKFQRAKLNAATNQSLTVRRERNRHDWTIEAFDYVSQFSGICIPEFDSPKSVDRFGSAPGDCECPAVGGKADRKNHIVNTAHPGDRSFSLRAGEGSEPDQYQVKNQQTENNAE